MNNSNCRRQEEEEGMSTIHWCSFGKFQRYLPLSSIMYFEANGGDRMEAIIKLEYRPQYLRTINNINTILFEYLDDSI